jgi:hypothetical protein
MRIVGTQVGNDVGVVSVIVSPSKVSVVCVVKLGNVESVGGGDGCAGNVLEQPSGSLGAPPRHGMNGCEGSTLIDE